MQFYCKSERKIGAWRAEVCSLSSEPRASQVVDGNPAVAGSGRVSKLGCEMRNGPSVNLALVPLLEHGEIRAARFPILATLPAVTGKIIGRGCEDVSRAVQEIATTIAVE